jgi:hypothetical protein
MLRKGIIEEKMPRHGQQSSQNSLVGNAPFAQGIDQSLAQALMSVRICQLLRVFFKIRTKLRL